MKQCWCPFGTYSHICQTQHKNQDSVTVLAMLLVLQACTVVHVMMKQCQQHSIVELADCTCRPFLLSELPKLKTSTLVIYANLSHAAELVVLKMICGSRKLMEAFNSFDEA